MTAPFNAGKHPRAAGGLFAATAASQSAHPTGAWAAGPIRKGTGRKGLRDPRVVAMQRQFNALGITDEHGRPLLVDGIDGAHTTAAVKKFQAANKLPQTGVVDAKTMVAILTAQPAPKPAAKPAAKRSARSRMRPKPQQARTSTPQASPSTPPAITARAYMDRGAGHSRSSTT